jgi:pseudaminic acid biosynthesis-associated methylase
MADQDSSSEATRLERLWRTEFGDEYVERNRRAGEKRRSFWQKLLSELDAQTVLEVGCNIGVNLDWIVRLRQPRLVCGVDVNLKALNELRRAVPDASVIWSLGRQLPFRDGCFDLVFTTGVLIHQPEDSLSLVMAEIVRCSRRYILCGEYFASETIEVEYRGQTGALFKRDYGRMYKERFPQLHLCTQGVLSREQGWDDIRYWVFEK